MRIYLDLCAIQRPFDVANHIRIQLEAEAVLGIITLSDEGKIELVSSEVLEFENNNNTNENKQRLAADVLTKASTNMKLTDAIAQRATELTVYKVKSLDALHLAVAEAARCDYLCTCDDRFLKRANDIPDLLTKVVNPIDLVKVIDQ